MIKVSNMSKEYRAFKLNNINIHLPKGYIMGLVGRNGAGKTTLLRILAGMEKADSGSVIINGFGITENEENAKKAKDSIGFVFLDNLFIDEASLIKNSRVYGKYYTRFNKDTLVKYCEEFDLDIKRKYKKLSKGEKLKFQLAFALAHQPKLLILDEPAANFDRNFRKKFIKTLTEFVSDGEKSVIIATHLTEDLDRIADYVAFMDCGKIEMSMDRETLMESFKLISGDTEKCNLISKELVIYREDGKYGSKLLIDLRSDKIKNNIISSELTVETPSIEDIMYYITKGKEAKEEKKEDNRYV